MRAREVALVGALTLEFPVLTPILQDHLDYNKELLTHMYLADVTRWMVREFERDPDSSTLRKLLDYLESRLVQGDEAEQEIIGVSFVENLPYSHEPNGEIRNLLGPALRKQAALMDSA